MSTYKVTAWRDATGARGISAHARTAVGYDNVIAEITLIGDDQVERFLERCQEAWERAQAFTEPTEEPSPGAYDGWAGED